ncbi:ABC-type sugar transport system, periplasmic component [Frankia canadensis]|uniref:ABC-type sugar transport system, periplasmic component n=2 Tax=Frankia canadensis TaxID=1836972 RepID=A0A2I2KWI5_9ACTN|nr:ABC-type sugar transport system, periplasmic component [Frankia canadensis]SOU57333.1 ABC-type sugar transport system, periplasmic component [Frankia canadensis]
MRMRRTLPTVVALGMIVLTACGGGGGSSNPADDVRPTARTADAGVAGVAGATASPECAARVKTLRMAAVGTLNDVAKSGKAYMEKAHPGLTVELTATAPDYSALVQQISADRSAGRTADVAVAGFDQLPVYARQLGAQVLSPSLLRPTYDQRLLRLGTVDGKLVGIPQQVSTLALVYNLDILQKAGVDPKTLTTTDGVIAAADKIKASGQNVQPIDLPTGQQFGQWVLNTLASSKGTPIQDAAGRPALTTPAAREAAQFLAKVGTYGPQSDDPTQQGLLRFGIRRQVAITAVTVASLAGGLKFIADQGTKGFRAGAIPFPTLPGGSQHPVAGGNALTVLATDRCQQEMATELVVSLLSPDVVAASTEAFSYIPVDSQAISQLGPFYETYPQLKPFLALTGSLVKAPVWTGARGGEVPTALSNQVVRITRGEDPARTLADAQTQAEELNR